MQPSSPTFLIGDLTHYEAQVTRLEDVRLHPPESALTHVGHAMMTELLDVISDTALDDFPIIAESLIGALHSAAQRIDREGDKARDEINRGVRDFDVRGGRHRAAGSH